MSAKKLLISAVLLIAVYASAAYADDPKTLPSPQVLNRNPSVAANTDENTALVVWESDPDSTRQRGAVYASLLTIATDGSITIGPTRKISTSSANNGRPSVAFNPDTGTYLVAWSEFNNQAGIWVREVNANGTPLGKAIEIISDFATENDPRLAYIGGSGGASFLLVYSRNGGNGTDVLERGLWGVKLDDGGMAIGDEWPLLLGDIYDSNGQDVRSAVIARDIAAADGSAHVISTMFTPVGDAGFSRCYVTWIKLSSGKVKSSQTGLDDSDFGRIAALGKRWTAAAWQEPIPNNQVYINRPFRKHKAKKKAFAANAKHDNKATALVRITDGAALVYTVPGPETFLQILTTKGLRRGPSRSMGKFNIFNLRGALLSNNNQILIVGVTRFSSTSAEIQAFIVKLNR